MTDRNERALVLLVVGLASGLFGLGAQAQAGFLEATSSARLLVAPPQTEVYLDGERVGVADDFDGFTQRLRVEPGEHEIELFLDGHRSVRERILFAAGQTYKIRHAMEPLAPGGAAAQRPEPRRPVREAPPPPRRSSYGALAVTVRPLPATLWIDGERWDASGGFRVQLAPGRHDVEIRAEGRGTYTTTVTVLDGDTTALNVSLTRSNER